MPYKIIPGDFTTRLTRIQAELARRNGYGDLSGHASETFPAGTPIAVGGLITAPVFNTLRSGLAYIKSAGLPSEAVAGVTYINTSDLVALDAAITAFEAQPRGAVSNNDCAAQCSGMCVSQCTTTCLSTCTGGCADACAGTCTGTCDSGCTGTCTVVCGGNCTSTCTGGCTGSCTASCADGCGSYCSVSCSGTCKGTCKGGCTASHMDD